MPDDLSPLWDKLEATESPDERLLIVREALTKTSTDVRGEYVEWRLQLLGLLDQDDPAEADDAVKTLEELIAVSPRDSHENDWIRLHRHLGTAYLFHPNASALDPKGDKAKAAFESALSAFTKESNPTWWGKAHWRLSLIYWERRPAGDRTDLENAANHLEEAISALPSGEQGALIAELKTDLMTIRAELAE